MSSTIEDGGGDDDDYGGEEGLDDFPIVGSAQEILDDKPSASSSSFDFPAEEEVSFSGKSENYCVCFIDMVNSTVVTSGLASAKLVRYYSIFLNATAAIAKNFGAKVIKNAGDCLIYYFPATSDPASNAAFSDVLECCTAMIDANKVINARLNTEGLPPLGYRISADYGKVEVARSATSNSDDLFGSTMNLCAKINSKAPKNGVVVGADLYRVIQSIPAVAELYNFEQVCSYLVGPEQQQYPVFSVARRQKRNIVNPFKVMPARS
ncbi:adenylate/guanylate cyclase domain-containing protein [Nitrososphaera viennensis]|uniref:Adenylate/guanylate cyclase domain-containing protein n=2 Tax=Nitrososphaera viennensis TaxID=1034015 RepID=A0A977IDF7_9ARCH|nr:adenylate/guanylate cyclase domain-containing protein [Nitrososphaera viennensis]UVS68969.1 adenylate/guanylate cyclase domain-containing protein [Nitrososphaera viennensis]